MKPEYDVVIPTIGRPSLGRLLRSLHDAKGPRPRRVFVVDDRRDAAAPLDVPRAFEDVHVLASGGKGPAAARNRGLRESSAPWVVFLDDDVTVGTSWRRDLAHDLAAAGSAAASYGRVSVPLPDGRRATDWERNVHGLEHARWITADCALRRDAALAVGGFDERFRRAYREDTDLALRLVARGERLVQGRRLVEHPVRAADPWISVRLQAGNADDALMDALHGAGWRDDAGAPRGSYVRYSLIVGAAAVALVASAVWAAATARFAWRRIAPGPRTPREIATMALTSVAIPFAAVYHRVRGRRAARRLVRRAAAVLFDRDGTLIDDVPVLGDPALVAPMPGAHAALARLRAAGCAVGVITNQSALAEQLFSRDQLAHVHRRVEELLGRIDVWAVCEHGADAGCSCRKPAPGLILDAARRLKVAPGDCVVVGDILSDVLAATAAGARGILVPNPATLGEEVERAPVVAPDLAAAADLIVRGVV